MAEPEGPAGGHGDTGTLLPRKVGGGLSPWFRTKWHRGDKARAQRRSTVLRLRMMRVLSPDATARRRLLRPRGIISNAHPIYAELTWSVATGTTR